MRGYTPSLLLQRQETALSGLSFIGILPNPRIDILHRHHQSFDLHLCGINRRLVSDFRLHHTLKYLQLLRNLFLLTQQQLLLAFKYMYHLLLQLPIMLHLRLVLGKNLFRQIPLL